MNSPRLLYLLLLLAASSASGEERTVAATAPSTGAQSHCFTAVQNPPFTFSKVDGHLAIGGYSTDYPYPKYPPGIFQCTHFLLQFSAGEFALWNDHAHVLSATIDGFLAPISRKYNVLVQRAPPFAPESILDVDPDDGRFRALYTANTGESLQPVGLCNDSIYFFVSRTQGSGMVRDLLEIKSADLSSTRMAIDIKDFRWFVDAVRGDRILLYKFLQSESDDAKAPPRVQVAILDISTNRIREIGKIDGGWGDSRNCTFPICNVRWISADELAELTKSTTAPTVPTEHLDRLYFAPTYIREDTEQLLPPTQKKE